jgi:formate dehydrogenase iron-sulfur subunit
MGDWERDTMLKARVAEPQFFGGPGYQNPDWPDFINYNLIRFFEAGGPGEKGVDVDGDDNWHFLRYACMHCEDPRCLKICEEKRGSKVAVYIDCDGFVQIDKRKCRPDLCEYACVNWCAFKIPQVGRTKRRKSNRPPTWSKRWARKCTACIDRRAVSSTPFPSMPCSYTPVQYPTTAAGNPNNDPIAGISLLTDVLGSSVGGDLLPACVTSCPTGALKYGDRADVIATAHARVADAQTAATWPELMVYGDTGPFGGLHVISVLTKHWSFYGLPDPAMTVT